LVATAAGSTWYHLDPNDATLAWDRVPMTVVFAGVLGVALARRVGDGVARIALAAMLALGVASVVYWRASGDLSLYLTLQFGGIAALVLLLLVTRRGDDPFAWWWLLAWYAAAKLVEAADAAIWSATGGLVAGHALKHLFAAIGVAGLFWPLEVRGALAAASAADPRTSGPP
jgi:hypothetical protein